MPDDVSEVEVLEAAKILAARRFSARDWARASERERAISLSDARAALLAAAKARATTGE